MLYNVSVMVNLWSALAARDTRLLKAQLDALNSLPEHCWFVNYLRCHDDIGWGLDEETERRLGIDPQQHKEYLYRFYEGGFPGSWARGELYNYDPATRDARSCGTTASLCGVEKALLDRDGQACQTALRRVLLMHTAMAFCKGFPMLNCGDEVAQLNGWDYHSNPDLAEDSRNLHRSPFNWHRAARRNRPGTMQNAVWQGLAALRALRSDPCFGPSAWVTTWDAHNDAVLAVVRRAGGRTLAAVLNFADREVHARLDALPGEFRDPAGQAVSLQNVTLPPYGVLTAVQE